MKYKISFLQENFEKPYINIKSKAYLSLLNNLFPIKNTIIAEPINIRILKISPDHLVKYPIVNDVAILNRR